MVEEAISKATDERLCENMQACLGWLKEYGYPKQKCQLWAFDGVVRCQKIDDAYKVYATLPDFTDRRDECYAIVSSHSCSQIITPFLKQSLYLPCTRPGLSSLYGPILGVICCYWLFSSQD